MLTKQKIIACMQELPEKFSADEIIDRIILLEKIEIGLDQIENGQVLSDEELDKILSKWL